MYVRLATFWVEKPSGTDGENPQHPPTGPKNEKQNHIIHSYPKYRTQLLII